MTVGGSKSSVILVILNLFSHICTSIFCVSQKAEVILVNMQHLVGLVAGAPYNGALVFSMCSIDSKYHFVFASSCLYLPIQMIQWRLAYASSSARIPDSLCSSHQSARKGEIDQVVFTLFTEGKN